MHLFLSITVYDNQVETPPEGQMLNCSANCNLAFVTDLVNTPLMNRPLLQFILLVIKLLLVNHFTSCTFASLFKIEKE